MQNKGKGDLQSDVLFATNMDDLLSNRNMSQVIRSSVNVNPNVINASHIKKSIRGGAGSSYRKGSIGGPITNQSVNLDLMANRGMSLALPQGENLQ